MLSNNNLNRLNSTSYFCFKLTLKILWSFTKNVLQKNIFPSYQYNFSYRLFFRKNIQSNHDNDEQVRDEKLQYNINRNKRLSALSSGKIDKYEYLTGAERLLSDQSQMIQQAKFTYSSLGKEFEKQTQTIEDQGKNKSRY